MVGNRFIVPVYGPLPVWTFGPRYNLLGEYVDEGWRSTKIYDRTFATEVEAQAFIDRWKR